MERGITPFPEEDVMAEGQWGNCKGCRYFANQTPQSAGETHRCMQPELAEFELEVSGESGCNAYEARTGVATPAYEGPSPSLH
ncbi:hypothetical protein JKA73_32650 [Myxococcus xanthus]|nr:hypothetical protein JKA73_32650 [Myxococcus xanthus]